MANMREHFSNLSNHIVIAVRNSKFHGAIVAHVQIMAL